MLEVNDFNAIRISLASPEQIRSWSYGEVTKPETINYRTLKPEKDGLFCERIFGPTKDFECYCGKYKRVRYKGIVCDKCGVEVARAKVRRERMGHIELASPVAHIWFVKGTPSRLSLLLDVSPRNLERVVYFAQFIVTHVDEAEKTRVRQQLREEMGQELARLEEEIQEHATQLQAQREAEVARWAEQRKGIIGQVQEDPSVSLEVLREQARGLEERLGQAMGKKARANLKLGTTVIAPRGSVVGQSHLILLQEALQAQEEELQAHSPGRQEAQLLLVGAELEQREQQWSREREELRRKVAAERDRLKAELKAKEEELEEIRPLALLADDRHRRLRDTYDHLFRTGMGAEAILDILAGLDLEALRAQLQGEVQSTSGQRRKKATKRLRVVEAFRKSGNNPEWMVFTVLPVLPPDLRPMVQLDGGRFATSDLNDLYRRVINRNNRLRRLLELGAPEIIIRNEKRMLQEAVDSLIDNGRRGRAVAGTGNHRLKSLSDMLKGKQGRFRQNLLGKRVDYSGRSVIVVGPELQLHQCGLPKRMALELFKPFVMRGLVERGYAHNIKSAKRIVERVKPEVWDVIEEVIKDRLVLLNRAPTLHRLGIQAFQPILIEGSAIQLHPLVCSAFNADFDGDQMAVHVPLSEFAVEEARKLMLSSRNLLSPSSGEPTVAPTMDMVLGCYYLTNIRPGAKGEGRAFSNLDEAKLAHDLGQIDLQAEIVVRTDLQPRLRTSIGRLLFNQVLPPQLGFHHQVMDKQALKQIVADCYRQLGEEETAAMVDRIKEVGFRYATRSGMTIAMNDLMIPIPKEEILAEADAQVQELQQQYQRGLITEEERYAGTVEVWTATTTRITQAISQAMDPFGSLYVMANSGAKGNIAQIRQMAGMRGLMSDPAGRIIELPIKSSFREGLTVLEYFISTHGARKGLADTALRTADSGYLTRRLIDVAQDLIVLEEDCGTTSGVWIADTPERSLLVPLEERIIGRMAASPLAHPETGEVLVQRNQEIDEESARALIQAGISRVHVRSPLGCLARRGLCQLCYGRSLATGRIVDMRQAVGIIAAQSIGEPGTQLTMRTFHTGGVAGIDITSGLPRVEELFEARIPKGEAIISEIDGLAEVIHADGARRIRVVSSEIYKDEYLLPSGWELLVENGQTVEAGAVMARGTAELHPPEEASELALAPAPAIVSRMAGTVALELDRIAVYYEEREEREYPVPAAGTIRVEHGARAKAGDQLTDGSINPQDILRILGREAVQLYLVEEVQKVYRSQGVNINDKHIEAIVRQMLRKVRVDAPGDTDLLPGELVDRFLYEEINAKVLAEGGEPATAETVLLGITKASLNTESFLAAASFQETSRVLTEAAATGSTDRLLGLKENVIIGKLIPAQGLHFAKPEPPQLPDPFPTVLL